MNNSGLLIVCTCVLGLMLINKPNKEVKEAGVLSHQEYYYDDTEEISEDEDGLTPIRTSIYEPVEENE